MPSATLDAARTRVQAAIDSISHKVGDTSWTFDIDHNNTAVRIPDIIDVTPAGTVGYTPDAVELLESDVTELLEAFRDYGHCSTQQYIEQLRQNTAPAGTTLTRDEIARILNDGNDDEVSTVIRQISAMENDLALWTLRDLATPTRQRAAELTDDQLHELIDQVERILLRNDINGATVNGALLKVTSRINGGTAEINDRAIAVACAGADTHGVGAATHSAGQLATLIHDHRIDVAVTSTSIERLAPYVAGTRNDLRFHPEATAELVAERAQDYLDRGKWTLRVVRHPHASGDTLAAMWATLPDGRARRASDEAHHMAMHRNTPSEILDELATSTSAEVRRIVAANQSTALPTLLELARRRPSMVQRAALRNPRVAATFGYNGDRYTTWRDAIDAGYRGTPDRLAGILDSENN